MLLAFDTSSPTVTVAVHDGADVVAQLVSAETMRHGEQLTPLVDRALGEVGITARDLTAIGVGVGPGPFTGLRVGLVSARTMAYALQIPVYGVCSLDVLAVEAVDTGAVSGSFVVATDARRREVYLATYDEAGHRVAGPDVQRPAEIAASVGGLPVVGEGAALYPDTFPDGRPPLRPSAGWLARCVVEERVELRDPEPLYLRRPDAEIPRAPKPVS
ncbi:tRNA (adenosine(37)-N6)-threonylcarbamoyltransferase complex dimerization subunit type 1 TsaB [Nocardioides bizhenqiangii]|uniref:tRNA (Adenosine(37)-N6)-threonylcarbamoyltransferase complex dimerization subunit type 1 TsaB n=1 Tax=Nocardioides bizhenqiangii TaxID=3095076 RepID=A0ABZ0ZPR6_9ACTN|nr:tRNA (adenosine(37)-N6)-threonylcarbamoyltransferase complex dimerization subunit type 1 TsaB [Nocardioides sp. HM61]WQQ25754.1 tRNA (adenosine(37)-N6)-threonylcarbamoyltransferase complex dimerization subunit type 1 TsaB [Nocardioides sp. HM61]